MNDMHANRPASAQRDAVFPVTFFPDRFAKTKTEELQTVPLLVRRIQTAGAPTKHGLPLLKLATFGQSPTPDGSLRSNANMLTISGVEGDYELGDGLTIEQAAAMARAAGVFVIFYTSPSHTEDAPRWRVLAVLSKQAPAGGRVTFVDRLNGVLGGILRPESWTPSQAFYLGSVANNPSHRVIVVDGEYLDLRADLDAGAIASPTIRERAAMPPRAPGLPLDAVPENRLRKIVNAAIDAVRAAPAGTRHHVLLAKAKWLGGLLHYGQFNAADIEAWLLDALPVDGSNQVKDTATIRDGIGYGQAAPVTLEDRPLPPRSSHGADQVGKIGRFQDTDDDTVASQPQADDAGMWHPEPERTEHQHEPVVTEPTALPTASDKRARYEIAKAKGAEARQGGASFEAMAVILATDPATAPWYAEIEENKRQHIIRRIWDAAGTPINRDDDGNVVGIAGQALNEDGVALAFAGVHKDQLHFDHTIHAWFVWTGIYWRRDDVALAFSWARNICRNVAYEGGAEPSRLNTLAKASTAAAVERFAQSDPVFAVGRGFWDQDNLLLGTPGGTVDLTTQRLRPALPGDRITKQTAVAPADVPDCPKWMAFLDQVTGNDVGLIRFLRQFAGYCLTGETKEHALLFLFGDGGNGKGVFVNTIAGIMGDYACRAAMDTFTETRGDRHPTELADLAGARLVTASETEEGRAWAEARLNAITGGDEMSARFMRQDFFKFKPQFKLIFMGNHKPVLKTVNEAARRRFNIVPFNLHIPEADRNMQLEAELQAEWPGILRWMIEGCLDWRMHKLIRPDVVRNATAGYFSEQDTVGSWVEDCCTLDRRESDTATRLFASWTEYAARNGEKPGTSKVFAHNLQRIGCQAVPNTPGHHNKRGFLGITLNPDVVQRPPQDRPADYD